MNNNSRDTLKVQKKHFFILAGVLIIISFGIMHFIFSDLNPTQINSSNPRVDLPVDNINPQNIWMTRQDDVINRLDSENKLLDQKMKLFEEIILSNKKKEEETEREKIELKQVISALKGDLQTVIQKSEFQGNIQEIESTPKEVVTASFPPQTSQNLQQNLFSSPRFQSVNNSNYKDEQYFEPKPLRMPIREHVLVDTKAYVSVDEVVPAAVSVKALLVSSVDAVCGVYANSDPVPVKLRLLDDAHLPNGVKIDLKGSLLIASAYGNISNERVYMRLERLTQVNSKGEAIETDVVGYVSGEDGKFGVQGSVIDRSCKIVKNAAVSGFLGGAGQVLQAAVSRHPVDSFNTYSVGTDIAQQGAASGASSAFDMLAEYYIRRAEQVQPVLQVNAGRIVDITFTHGFSKGDLNTKEKLKQIRCKSRRIGP